MKREIRINIGFGFVEGLALLLIVLKLTNRVTWSWLWVLAPIWIQLILLFVALVGLAAIVIVASKIYEDF